MVMKFGNSKRYGMRKKNISNLMATNYGVPFASPAKDAGHGEEPGHEHDENIDWEDKVTTKTSTTKGDVTTDIDSYTQKGTTKKKPYVGEKHDACSEWYIKTHGRKKCDEYEKLPPKDRSQLREGSETKCHCPDPVNKGKTIKWTITKGGSCSDERPAACTKKPEKKKCECQSYKADGSKGPMVAYPCGGMKNPNCYKRNGDTTDIGYKKECQEKPNYAKRKAQCEEGGNTYKPGTWDDHYCRCDHKKKIKIKLPSFKKSGKKCPKGSKRKGNMCWAYGNPNIGTKFGKGGN